MNKRMLPAAAVTVVVAAAVAIAGCQQKSAAPTQAPVTKVVQPKVHDMKLAKALANQKDLIDRAAKLKVDERMPQAAAHSAGGAAEAALARQEATPPTPTTADDKRSLAIWFSGNEIGETDPCG